MKCGPGCEGGVWRVFGQSWGMGDGRGGRVFALGGCEEGGGGGFWTGAGEACQCRRSYGYVRKSNELRIARAVNLVTELVCPGGGASNAEQARQDGGWRRSCIPNKKRGPPPARYPMSGVGGGPQASDTSPVLAPNPTTRRLRRPQSAARPARSAMGCPPSEMARASKICLL